MFKLKLIIIAILLFISNSYLIPESEWNALYDLYNSTNGNYWTWQNETYGLRWNFSNPSIQYPCGNLNLISWQGLFCTCRNNTINHEFDDYYNYYDDNIDPIEETCNIKKLFLEYKNLTGTINDSISNLNYLTHIHLSYNNLWNSMPNLSNITNLTLLDLTYNYLTGDISFIYGLYCLSSLQLGINLFSGTISSRIGLLTLLERINLNDNEITGSLPIELGNLKSLLQLNLGYNYYLTGNLLPIVELSNLNSFSCIYSSMTGSIPFEISNLVKLNSIELSGSLFTASIPTTFGLLTNLKYLFLRNNFFSNAFPSEIGNLKSIVNIYVDYNFISGPLYKELSYLPLLNQIRINNNFFSSSLPDELYLLSQLEHFDCSYNYFSGTLSKIMSSNWTFLESYFLNDNKFIGNIENLVCLNMINLININIGHNSFTSTIPSSIFFLPKLQAFAAYCNCFISEIPDNLCLSTTLSTLILDGLHSSETCKDRIFPDYSIFPNTYYGLFNVIKGGIPNCVYNMSNLKTLHLSGNGITGSFSESIVISKSLQDLSISNNAMRGHIPENIQLNYWQTELDLSMNFFNGVLLDNFDVNKSTTVSLHRNRLSGYIPNSLLDLKNIDILVGNIFSCSIFNRVIYLPLHDPYYDFYSCGSNNFDLVLFFGLSVIIIFIIIKFNRCNVLNQINSNLYFLKSTFKSIYQENSSLNELNINKVLNNELNNQSNITILCCFYDELLVFLKQISMLYLILFIPLSIILTYFFSMYTYSYSWKYSSIFLSGTIPAIIQMFMMIISFYIVHRFQISLSEIQIVKRNAKSKLSKFYIYFSITIFNMIIFGYINVKFVTLSINEKGLIILLFGFAISLFKVLSIIFIIPSILKWYHNTFDNHLKFSRNDQFFESSISVLNSIIIPFLTTATVSANCLLRTIVPEPQVKSSFYYLFCTLVNANSNECDEYKYFEVLTSYWPPFIYSFQCSSSLLKIYSPIFIFMALLLAIQTPLMRNMIHLVNIILGDDNHYFNTFIKVLPSTIKPFKIKNIEDDNNNNVLPIYFNKNIFSVNIITYLAIILTVGNFVPILGIFVCICLCFYIHNVLSNLGFMLHESKYHSNSSYEYVIKIFERDADEAISTIKLCLIILFPVRILFLSFFIFDTLGDEIGAYPAFISIAVMIAFVSLLFIILNKIYYNNIETIKRNSVNKLNLTIELSSSIIKNPLI